MNRTCHSITWNYDCSPIWKNVRNLAGEISAFQFELLELLLRAPGRVVPVEEPQVNLLTRHLKSENIFRGIYFIKTNFPHFKICISSSIYDLGKLKRERIFGLLYWNIQMKIRGGELKKNIYPDIIQLNYKSQIFVLSREYTWTF